jgi:hypothetical protein
MPIHLDDLDVISEVAGLSSVLIVPCNMCPAVTLAVREKKPFIRFFRSFLKSDPFEQHIKALQSRLRQEGVNSEVFRSDLPHQWFVCMWTSGRRKKLQNRARQHDAVIVLGCDTANETVRLAVKSTGCKVIEGMEVVGFMNAKMKLHFPGDVCFEDCKVIPIAQRNSERGKSHWYGTRSRKIAMGNDSAGGSL